MPIVITNTMNIIGEMQDPEKFVPMVIKKVLRGETVMIHGTPPDAWNDEVRIGSRYYLHARNQADALLHVLSLPVPLYGEAETPEKFHIVGEREVDNLEMAQKIADIIGMPLKYEVVDFHSSRPGHDLRYALDGAKIAATGWEAPYSLEESLKRTIEWTLENPEWLL